MTRLSIGNGLPGGLGGRGWRCERCGDGDQSEQDEKTLHSRILRSRNRTPQSARCLQQASLPGAGPRGPGRVQLVRRPETSVTHAVAVRLNAATSPQSSRVVLTTMDSHRPSVTNFVHVGLVVEDLDETVRFLALLGFDRGEPRAARGEWIDRIIGLENVTVEAVVASRPRRQRHRWCGLPPTYLSAQEPARPRTVLGSGHGCRLQGRRRVASSTASERPAGNGRGDRRLREHLPPLATSADLEGLIVELAERLDGAGLNGQTEPPPGFQRRRVGVAVLLDQEACIDRARCAAWASPSAAETIEPFMRMCHECAKDSGSRNAASSARRPTTVRMFARCRTLAWPAGCAGPSRAAR